MLAGSVLAEFLGFSLSFEACLKLALVLILVVYLLLIPLMEKMKGKIDYDLIKQAAANGADYKEINSLFKQMQMGEPVTEGFHLSPTLKHREMPSSAEEGKGRLFKLPEVKKKNVLPSPSSAFSSSNLAAFIGSSGAADVVVVETTGKLQGDSGSSNVSLINNTLSAALDERLNPYVRAVACKDKLVEVGPVEVEVRGLASQNSDMQIGAVLLDTRHLTSRNAVLGGMLMQASNKDQHVLCYPGSRLPLTTDINDKLQVVYHSDNSDMEPQDISAVFNVRACSEIFDAKRRSHPTKRTLAGQLEDQISAVAYSRINCLVLPTVEKDRKFDFHDMKIPLPPRYSFRLSDTGDFVSDSKGRKSICFTGFSQKPVLSEGETSAVRCTKHLRHNCCDEHMLASGSHWQSADEIKCISMLQPQGITYGEWLPARVDQIEVPMNSNPGEVVYTQPITVNTAEFFPGTAYLAHLPFVKMKAKIVLAASGTIQSQGLLRVVYDPNNAYFHSPVMERALMLQGVTFQPGRDETVEMEFEVETISGFTALNFPTGSVHLVTLDQIRGFTQSLSVDLKLYFQPISVEPKFLDSFGGWNFTEKIQFLSGERSRDWLPLSHPLAVIPIQNNFPRGKNFVFHVNPHLPSTDGTSWYPSLSSTVLERAICWRGEVFLSIHFSLPVAAGGRFAVAVCPFSFNGATLSQNALYGMTTFDLKNTRKVHVSVPITSWAGFNTAGQGSLLRANVDGPMVPPSVILMPLSSVFFPGDSNSGNIIVVYEGIKNFNAVGCSITEERIWGAPVIASGDTVQVEESVSEIAGVPEGRIFRSLLPKGLLTRIATITSSPANALLIFPVTPACQFAKVAPQGASMFLSGNCTLAHRAQEFCFWRGSMRYFFSVRRSHDYNSKVSPTIEVSLAPPAKYTEPDFVVGSTPHLEGIVSAWKFDFKHDLSPSVFIDEGNASTWRNTQNSGIIDFSMLSIAGWIVVRMPSGTFNSCGISEMDILVQEDLQFRVPAPPFPVPVQHIGPRRYREDYHFVA